MIRNTPSKSNQMSLTQSPVWIKVVIVGITLSLAWYFGQSPSISIIGFIAALGGTLVVVRYPQLGVLALIPIALLVPYAIGTGTQTALNLAFLGIPALWGVVFIRTVVYGRTWDTLITRETWPLVGLTITAAVSLVSGYLPWNPFAQLAPLRAQLGALSIFAFSAAACILVATVFESERWLQIFTVLFLCLGGIYILGRAIPQLQFINTLIIMNTTGSVFWIWLVVLSAGQVFFNNTLDLRLRSLLIGLTILIFVVAFVYPQNRGWASGWLPAGVGLGVILWLRWPRLAFTFAFLSAFVILLNYQTIQTILLEGDNAYSLLTRGLAFEILWKVVQANPLLGVGPANYYYYTPLYSILGYYVRFNSHNQYIDILAQSGLLGLFFFLWFIVEMFRTCWKLKATKTLSQFGQGYVHGAIGGLAGMLVAGALGDWLIPFVYNIGVSGFRSSLFGFLFLGGVLVLKRVVARHAPETQPGAVPAP